MPRPAPGLMSGYQLQNWVGSQSGVIILHYGVAYEVITLARDTLVPPRWQLQVQDREGRTGRISFAYDELIYVTRKDLVGWPDRRRPPRDLPFE